VGDLSDILQRLESSLGPLTGEPIALDGGITNRNFRATLGGEDYVIRQPGKDTDLLGIDREAERLANDAAAQLGIAPAVAAALEDCLVTRFISCRSLAVTELAGRVDEIALALRGFHDCPARLPTRFRVPELLDDYARIAQDRGGQLPAGYADTVDLAARIAAALPLPAPRPCHNDLLPGNIIHAQNGGRMMIVDWEYAGMGDPRFDLGNLSVNNDFDEATDERLLTVYYGAPASDSQRAALKLMRLLSDAREAAWAVVQGLLSELEFDFEAYGREHFERLHGDAVRANIEEWLAAASA
jgi:thiamine kinase-like enzyme